MRGSALPKEASTQLKEPVADSFEVQEESFPYLTSPLQEQVPFKSAHLVHVP
jgi:hypothetical protein